MTNRIGKRVALPFRHRTGQSALFEPMRAGGYLATRCRHAVQAVAA